MLECADNERQDESKQAALWASDVPEDCEATIRTPCTSSAVQANKFTRGGTAHPQVLGGRLTGSETSVTFATVESTTIEGVDGVSDRRNSVQSSRASRYARGGSDLEAGYTEEVDTPPPHARKSKRHNSSKVLLSKITDFGSQREEEKLRMFQAVMWVFLRLLGLGACTSAVGAVCRVALPEDLIAVSGVILNFGFTLCISSLVIGSACPFDLLDVNKMFKKNPKFAISFFTACGFISLAQVLFFPHLELLKVLLSVAACMGSCNRFEKCWPLSSTWCVLWIILDRISWGCIFLFPQQNQVVGTFNPVSYSLGAFNLLGGAVTFGVWLRYYSNSANRGGKGASMGMYSAFYAWCLMLGMTNLVAGVALAVKPREGSSDLTRAAIEFSRGICVLTPAMLVLLLGRDNLFKCLGKRFDRDGARLQRDGAFIAELLETVPVHTGQLWWVHRDYPNESYPQFNPRRNWSQGVVTEVNEHLSEFLVQLPGGADGHGGGFFTEKPSGYSVSDHNSEYADAGPVVRLPLPAAGGVKSKETLLAQAQTGLRCVDFENLYPELMKREDARNNPELKAAWHKLSRPLRKGEEIDYFMSNSWYDDPEEKWSKLKEVADTFLRRYGRYPTLWIDKLCIDQSAITDGLKVLPVIVMACRKLLVLCGDTYPTRLWCIWELFTLFAFCSEATAHERIKFVFLGEYEDGLDTLDRMADFNVKDSHCYNPNDEERLRQVIEAVGTGRFNRRIGNMAETMKKRMEKEHGNKLLAVGRTASSASGPLRSPRMQSTLSRVSGYSGNTLRSPRPFSDEVYSPRSLGPPSPRDSAVSQQSTPRV